MADAAHVRELKTGEALNSSRPLPGARSSGSGLWRFQLTRLDIRRVFPPFRMTFVNWWSAAPVDLCPSP